jgi:hypothetical protein
VSLFGHSVNGRRYSRGFGIRPQRGVSLGLAQLLFEIVIFPLERLNSTNDVDGLPLWFKLTKNTSFLD